MPRRLSAILPAVVAVLFATPSHAAIMLATWTSLITDVGGPQKILPDTSLVGTELKVELRYDTARALVTDGIDEGGAFLHLASDKEHPPVLGLTLTYGGTNYDLGSSVGLDIMHGSDPRLPSYSRARMRHIKPLSYDQDLMIDFDMLSVGGVGDVPLDFEKPFSLDFFGNTTIRFVINETQSSPGSDVSIRAAASGDSRGKLTVVQLAPTAPVPEPTTWALLIVGFGVTGASLRRRAPAAAGIA